MGHSTGGGVLQTGAVLWSYAVLGCAVLRHAMSCCAVSCSCARSYVPMADAV